MSYEGQGAPGSVLTTGAAGRVWQLPFSTLQVGRYSVGPPPASGPQTLPLVQLSGPMPVASNRVQVGGPAIVLVQWEGKMNFSSVITVELLTTTEGVVQGPIVFPSSVNFPFSQAAFFAGSDPNEEVWITVDGTSIAGISNAFLSVLKIPLSF